MLVYILKSSAILAILFFFYKLFLEKENMHVFKRFYLLITLFLAFGIPLITFTSYVEVSSITEIGNAAIITNTPQQENLINYVPIILWSIYGFGIMIFFVKFIYNLLTIIRKINHNPKHKTTNFTNVLLQDLVTPHTFFKYIFLNKYQFETQQIPKEVLIHEQTHALEKHSLDILLIEIFQILFWFNPLIYAAKHSIKLNHEFLADQAVLNNGIDTSIYQKILLKFSSNNEQSSLVNAINYSFIKKRFTIMKTKTSKNTIWLRSLILLPLLAVLIYGFSEKVITQKEPVATENILIQVTKDKKILLNGEKLVTIKTLKKEIERIVKNYSPKQLAKTKAIIEVEGNIEKGFITDITIEAREAGITSRELTILEKETQDKATPKQIAEYNALAKKYNEMPKDEFIVKGVEAERMNYIYNLMTKAQKEKAEPYPNFPPPPPMPTLKKGESPKMIITKSFYNYKDSNGKEVDVEFVHDGEQLVPALPPPPPIPADATEEERKNYQATIDNYNKKKARLIKEISELEEILGTEEDAEIEEITEQKTGHLILNGKNYYYTQDDNGIKYYDRWGVQVDKNGKELLPPPPPNRIEHMKEIAKKGGLFYFEDKKITSDKAIEIIKKNKNINIEVIGSKIPVVKLYTKPIVIEEQRKYVQPFRGIIHYINGKKATLKQVEELNPDTIIKIDVIKKKEGKKGEVHITTKQ